MDTKKKKKYRMRFMLKGLKNVLICDGIAVVGLAIIAIIVALVRNTQIIKSIYMAYYFGGGLAMLVGVPQFYRRSERKRIVGGRNSDPMFGFYDWFGEKYEDKEVAESYEYFKGDGFWLGIMLVLAGILLMGVGVIVEMIFFR